MKPERNAQAGPTGTTRTQTDAAADGKRAYGESIEAADAASLDAAMGEKGSPTPLDYSASERDGIEGLMVLALRRPVFDYKTLTGKERDAKFQGLMHAQNLFAHVHSYDPERARDIWTRYTGGPPGAKLVEHVKRSGPLNGYQTIEQLATKDNLVETGLADLPKADVQKQDLGKVAEAMKVKERAHNEIGGALMDTMKVEPHTDSGLHLLRSFIAGYSNGKRIGAAIARIRDANSTIDSIRDLSEYNKTNQLGRYVIDRLRGVDTSKGPGGELVLTQSARSMVTKGPIGTATSRDPALGQRAIGAVLAMIRNRTAGKTQVAPGVQRQHGREPEQEGASPGLELKAG